MKHSTHTKGLCNIGATIGSHSYDQRDLSQIDPDLSQFLLGEAGMSSEREREGGWVIVEGLSHNQRRLDPIRLVQCNHLHLSSSVSFRKLTTLLNFDRPTRGRKEVR